MTASKGKGGADAWPEGRASEAVPTAVPRPPLRSLNCCGPGSFGSGARDILGRHVPTRGGPGPAPPPLCSESALRRQLGVATPAPLRSRPGCLPRCLAPGFRVVQASAIWREKGWENSLFNVDCMGDSIGLSAGKCACLRCWQSDVHYTTRPTDVELCQSGPKLGSLSN